MSDKITAYFGADVSEVEAKMATATRATKAYDAAINGVGRNGGGLENVTRHLTENERALERVRRKFGAGDMFREVLMGAGIGTGFALAEKAAELIARHWKYAAESAKKMLEFSEQTTELVLKGINRGQTEEQKLKSAEKEFQRTQAALRDAQSSIDTPDQEVMALVKANQEAGNKVDEIRAALATKEKERKKKAEEEAKKASDKDLNLKIENQIRSNELDNKAAEEKKKREKELEDAQKKEAEQVDKIEQEIDMARYERIWKRATLEQKIAQAQKEGREAQAAYDKNKTAENLLALEKAKTKWLDLKDEINAAAKAQDKAAKPTSDPLATNGRVRGEDGKLHLGGAVVSDADAARSDAARARNAKLSQDAQRGHIRDSSPISKGETLATTNQILAGIDKKLSPKGIK